MMIEIMNFPLSCLLLLGSGVITATLGNPFGDGYPFKVSAGERGVNCHPVDSCEKVPERQFSGRNCWCDDTCLLWSNCCFDAEFKSILKHGRLKENEKCIKDDVLDPVYMVDTCGSRYPGDSLCTSNATDNDDPLLMIPVTSTATGTTYKNYFCALCNEDVGVEHLEPWNLKIVGWEEVLGQPSLPQLKYDRSIRAWTLVEGNSSVTVYVNARVPDILQSTVVPCQWRLVDRCAHNWSDADVETKCSSYMSLVEDKTGLQYRNPYCAICNYVDIKDIDCVHLPGFGAGSGAEFPLIKLFYLKDKRCEKDMVYDKFHGVCRCNARISIMKNGKCIYKIPEMKEEKIETE